MKKYKPGYYSVYQRLLDTPEPWIRHPFQANYRKFFNKDLVICTKRERRCLEYFGFKEIETKVPNLILSKRTLFLLEFRILFNLRLPKEGRRQVS